MTKINHAQGSYFFWCVIVATLLFTHYPMHYVNFYYLSLLMIKLKIIKSSYYAGNKPFKSHFSSYLSNEINNSKVKYAGKTPSKGNHWAKYVNRAITEQNENLQDVKATY
jgi:hypothetical protein